MSAVAIVWVAAFIKSVPSVKLTVVPSTTVKFSFVETVKLSLPVEVKTALVPPVPQTVTGVALKSDVKATLRFSFISMPLLKE